MSTPDDKVPINNFETKDFSELFLRNLNLFLETLQKSGKHHPRLIKLISAIGKISPLNEVESFMENGNEAVYTELGIFLGEALDKKALMESHIISFFEKILTSSWGFYLLHKCDLIEGISDSEYYKQNHEELSLNLTSTCLKKLLKLISIESEHDIQNACRNFLRQQVPDKIIGQAYKQHDIQDQKVLLKIFYTAGVKKSSTGRSGLIFNLKIANPKIFEDFYNSLSTDEQLEIDKLLEYLPNPIIKLIKKEDYKSASDNFVAHPESPAMISYWLQISPKEITEKQILEFFNVFMNSYRHRNIQMGFLILRACLESPQFLKENPNISISLITLYLSFSFRTKQLDEALQLLSSKPSWNEIIAKTLKIMPESEQGIHAALRALPAQKEQHQSHSHEWSLYEERLLFKFKQNISNLDNFSKAIVDIGEIIYSKRDTFHNLSVTHILIYFQKGIDANRRKEVSDILSAQPLMTPHILEAFTLLSKNEQALLLRDLLISGGSRYNAALVGGLKKQHSDLFNETLVELLKEDTKLYERVQKILTVPGDLRLIISDIMEQFSMPFRVMEAYAAKLFCAATYRRKICKAQSYQFNPTVLSGNELREYLNCLKLARPPLRERFILATQHWVSGEIEIPETGSPRILFIDSLGSGEPKTHALINQQCTNIFPQLDIYISSNRRQKSGLGCTLYALKDTQDLFIIGRYLEPKYNGNIFEYASKNKWTFYKLKLYAHELAYEFRLPLRFMRTQQDSDELEKLTIPNRPFEEQALYVNKKKETALESSKKYFKPYRDKKSVEGVRNERLVYKLNKMADDVFDYLASNQFDIQKIEQEMEQFSLASLKQRIATKSLAIEQLTPQVSKDIKRDAETHGALYFRGPKTDHYSLLPKHDDNECKSTSENSEIINAKKNAHLNLINIFQEKILSRIVYSLSSLINILSKEYSNGRISDISTLKDFLKKDLNKVQQRYFDHIHDDVYKNILTNLSILTDPCYDKVTSQKFMSDNP